MASLLAPYNSAMRLGMGFNSFTQQLCIDGAVLSKNLESASEEHLRPKYEKGVMDSRTSQTVHWTAKFVDRISEITDSLNVSGSLEIKCDAIGGGGGASASFVDSNKFKESDLNYFIQVTVVNQQLVAPEITEFCPIKHVSAADFTRVYGDAFISGFLEGGTFNALVSIKLKDRSKAKDIGGKLKVEMDLKTASVKGEAEGGKKSFESSYEGETTISVSWVGGGDIKGADVDDWTLENLKAVAMEFPEHVMACPMRTSAILTKYTGLKSFYEKSLNGSPLDYENAGVYSSALLDAYMDYKIMWRNISTGLWEVEHGQSYLEAKPMLSEFEELRDEINRHYKEQLVQYNQVAAGQCKEVAEEEQSESSQAVVLISRAPQSEAPLPPNALVPYKQNIFGLEKARQDCRFEMIKIVKEVDAVADDPKVASDPSRVWQYLNPSIFRLLLPVVHNYDAEQQAARDSAEARLAAEQSAKAAKDTQDDLAITKRKLADSESNLATAKIESQKSKKDAESLQEKLIAAQAAIAKLESQVSNPYSGYCPIPVGVEVKIRNLHTKMGLDHNVPLGTIMLHPSHGNTNQRWIFIRAKNGGYYVKSCVNDKYLRTTNQGDGGRYYMGLGSINEACTLFPENQTEPANVFMLRFCDRPEFTLNPEGFGTTLILWPGPKCVGDGWFIERV